MPEPRNVSPATLSVQAATDGIRVEYLDGRRVVYRAQPEPVSDEIWAPQWDHVHVLVADDEAGTGQVVYVNDRNTDPAILESTGVGLVVVHEGDVVTVAPGVDVHRSGERIRVSVESYPPDRSVYVFVESQLQERAYRLEPGGDVP